MPFNLNDDVSTPDPRECEGCGREFHPASDHDVICSDCCTLAVEFENYKSQNIGNLSL